jgi:hypothetical protein
MLHSTATLSSEGVCGLYGLRLMHRLNIFLSCFGHSGWAGLLFLCRLGFLTLTLGTSCTYIDEFNFVSVVLQLVSNSKMDVVCSVKSSLSVSKYEGVTSVRLISARSRSLSVTTTLVFSLTGIETSCFGGSLLPTPPDNAPLSNPLSLSFYNPSHPNPPFFLQLDLASTMHQPLTVS